MMGMWSGSSVRINDHRWRMHPTEEFLSWRKVVFSKQKGISESGGVRAFNRQWLKLAKKRGDWHMNEMITAKDASNYRHCGCWVEHCRCCPWNLAALELLPQGNIVCMYMYSMSSCIFTCNIRVIVIICALCCTYIFILHRLDSLLAEEALASCAAWQKSGLQLVWWSKQWYGPLMRSCFSGVRAFNLSSSLLRIFIVQLAELVNLFVILLVIYVFCAGVCLHTTQQRYITYTPLPKYTYSAFMRAGDQAVAYLAWSSGSWSTPLSSGTTVSIVSQWQLLSLIINS